jgi:DNA-binding XRE family transcriptional regulator
MRTDLDQDIFWSSTVKKSATYPSLKSDLADLGARVKAVRSAWGWSQETMADILRVDQASVSFWERGKIQPSGSAMVALSALFRCTIHELETGEGFRIPEAPTTGNDPSMRGLPRSVCLPPVNSTGITLVDLTSGAAQEKKTTEATKALNIANKQGRRIWVVVE